MEPKDRWRARADLYSAGDGDTWTGRWCRYPRAVKQAQRWWDDDDNWTLTSVWVENETGQRTLVAGQP